MPRSTSPSSVSSKRRRYDDKDAEASSSTRNNGGSHRDRSRERTRGSGSGGGGGERRRESGSGRDKDRDKDRDRDRDRDRDQPRSSRQHESSRDESRRSGRRERSPERDSSRRDRDHDRGSRGDSYRGSRETRSRSRSPNDRHNDRGRDGRRYSNSRSPAPASPVVSAAPPPKMVKASFTPMATASSRLAPSTPLSTNGAASPVSTPGTPRLDSPGPGNTEDEKLRAKREKVEAWKREREAKKAKEGVPSPAVLVSKPATSTSKLSHSNGLPAKPSLPSKPLSISTSTKSSSASVDQALAAAAAISSRLAPTNSLPPPSSSLPAKPTFSFTNNTSNAFKPSALKNSLSFGAEEVEDVKVGMMRFEGEIDMRMDVEGDEGDEGDDEDLEGGAAYKAREGGRDAFDAEMNLTIEEPSEETQQGKGDKMEINEEPVEEEYDELDAFMSGVAATVKDVDASDKMRLGGPPVKKTVLFDPEAGEVEEEIVQSEDEIDKVGMGAEDILALAAKKVVKRGRDLPKIDHASIAYEAFRKAFYHPPPEVEALTAEEVEEMRLEMDDIKVRGADAPRPAAKWSYCGLPAACIDVIKGLEYAAPTSIQAQAIPAIMSGRDIIGVAKTGSGKTIAFILPMFRHIKDQRPLQTMEGPIAIIMTPTRELATQIYRECKPFLKALNLRASCAYGGMPLKDNIADLKRGAELIVCTPGRMIELLTTNSGRVVNLRRVTYLVLDEADRMFDMGFEPQVNKIINQIRPDRQVVLFSATFPRQMEGLARKVLRRPLEITVGGRSIVAPEIEQIVEVREEENKFIRLLELLGRLTNEDADARALIFVERQEGADNLLKELLKKNYSCLPLHGGMEQVDRDQTIADLKAGVVSIVIATSVAARGLDVKQLKLVVQYDAPNHMEDYVHRAGRTGRAGNKGTCVTFVTPEQDRYALEIHKALTASGATITDELQALADSFTEKIKAGKASNSSGFGGKGLERLDQDRDALSRAERAAYGEASTAAEPSESTEPAVEGAPVIATNATTATIVAELEVEIKRGPAPSDAIRKPVAVGPSAAELAVPVLAAQGTEVGLSRAQSVVANFNALLKAKIQGRERAAEIDLSTDSARRRDPDATDFHAIIYINDYPQKARWKVTNKETMVQLVETTGASITNKGTFYEPGKEPGPGELPKLHFLIESNDESKVKHAISEIKRSLVEGATMAIEAEQRAGAGGAGGAATGRYSLM